MPSTCSSSAAVSPACPRRRIWRQPASGSPWSRRTASATAPRGATAGSSARGTASGRRSSNRPTALPAPRRCSSWPRTRRPISSDFARVHAIDIDYAPGQLSLAHRKRHLKDFEAHAETLQSRYDYPHIRYTDARETAERLGSTRYFGGLRDMGTGHIHPLKLLVGTARAAKAAGACSSRPRGSPRSPEPGASSPRPRRARSGPSAR